MCFARPILSEKFGCVTIYADVTNAVAPRPPASVRSSIAHCASVMASGEPWDPRKDRQTAEQLPHAKVRRPNRAKWSEGVEELSLPFELRLKSIQKKNNGEMRGSA